MLGPCSSASDGAGGAYFAWFQFGVPDRPTALRLQHLDANGNLPWGPRGLVVTAPEDWYRLNLDFLVSDGAGGVVVGWESMSYRLRAQRFDAHGRALWEAEGRPFASPPDKLPAHFLALPGPDLLVAFDGPDESIVATRYHVATGELLWGPVTLCSGASGTRTISRFFPAVAEDGAGGAVVTWDDSRGMVAQHVDADGNVLWGPDGLIVGAPVGYPYPIITSDGTGGAFLLWRGMVEGRISMLIERIKNAAPQWSPGNGIALDAMADSPPSWIVADGGGGAWLFGERRIIEGGPTDIVAGHVVDGVVAQLVEMGSVRGGIQQAVRGPHGIDVLLYEQLGAERGIRDIRLAGDGSLPWGSEGRAIVASPFVKNLALNSTVTEAGGGLLLSWGDERTDSLADLYATKIDDEGRIPGVGTGSLVRFLAADPTPMSTDHASLRFLLARDATVTLRVVDLRGRQVRALLRRETLHPGEHAIAWDGKDEEGRATPAGIYFVDIRANDESASGRVVITR